MTDDLVFSDEQSDDTTHLSLQPWQVMVVDDEPAVHEVTDLVMAGFKMDGRGLKFIHCYSAKEAYAVLSAPNDIALILLDVVMESEHAGLDLARQIREDIHNLNVRIVLRTGQPGQAPEEQVIRDYDINDYKEKTDLTRRKLITIFYAGLRAYRDLMRIEHARQGLRRSIEAISQVYDSQNLSNLSFFLRGKSQTVSNKLIKFQSCKMRFLNTKLKRYIYDFYVTNESYYSKFSFIMIQCSNIFRSERTNFESVLSFKL